MQHLAVIMDGNRRWARGHGFDFFDGSRDQEQAGEAQAFEAAIECCLRRNIPYLSVYALSVENLRRSDGSLPRLYSMLNRRGPELIKKLNERGVEMRFVGDRSLFDPSVKDIIVQIEGATRGNTKLRVSSLFCYGGQQDILQAARSLAERVAAGILQPQDLTPQMFEEALWTRGVPAPDLIIRTGGAQRLSNFLTYQSAYSEFVFLDVLWPDMTVEMFDHAVADFASTKRNFGA